LKAQLCGIIIKVFILHSF